MSTGAGVHGGWRRPALRSGAEEAETSGVAVDIRDVVDMMDAR